MSSGLVCGIDRSATALAVAEVAAELAAQLGLRLVIVHVDNGSRLRRDRSSVEAAHAYLESVARALSLRGAELVLRRGSPARALLDATRDEDADLLVVGAGARCRVAAAIAKHAHCPVVVVPRADLDHAHHT